jgi:hypothetical protein
MFNPFKKPQPRSPTTAMSKALVSGGLPPGLDPATLLVVARPGSYSGRKVSYFRVFDPIRVTEHAVRIGAFSDLDAHPDLVFGSGHIEHDGVVVLSRRTPNPVNP